MAQSAESMYNQINDPSGLVWVNHSGTDAVPDAVYAGKLANGQEVYVARAIEIHGNDFTYLAVGKFVPGWGVAFSKNYAHDRMTPSQHLAPPFRFQVLTNPNEVQIKWALDEGPNIHPNAVMGGFTRNTIRYIGRAKYEGNYVVGYLYSDYTTPPNGRVLVFNHTTRMFQNDCGTLLNSEQYEILLAKAPECCQGPPTFHLSCSKSYPKKMK